MTIIPQPLNTYDSIWMRPSVIAIFDRLKDTVTITTQIRPKAGISADEAYEKALERLKKANDKLHEALPTTPDGEPEYQEVAPTRNIAPERYKEMVRKAKDYIAKGDIFQVVLSQRFSIDFALPSVSLYRSLRRLNPSPFLFYFAMDDLAVVGSSPEILVRQEMAKLPSGQLQARESVVRMLKRMPPTPLIYCPMLKNVRNT